MLRGTGRRHVGNAESLDGRSGHAVGKTVGYDGQEQERQTHNERIPPNCNAPNGMPVVLQSVATVGGPDNPHQTQPTVCHVTGLQAHEVVFILRRMVDQANEWRIPIFVMDCHVAAAFDHVSHHLIIDAMEALKVPPVLVAAWIIEYREGLKLMFSSTTS